MCKPRAPLAAPRVRRDPRSDGTALATPSLPGSVPRTIAGPPRPPRSRVARAPRFAVSTSTRSTRDAPAPIDSPPHPKDRTAPCGRRSDTDRAAAESHRTPPIATGSDDPPPSPHHIQIDVHQAVGEVLLRVDRRRVAAVLPERASPVFSPVVRPADTTLDQLHAAADLAITSIEHHEMNVGAGYLVVEHAQFEPLAGLEEPLHPVAAVAGELQQ